MGIYPQSNGWECGPFALKYALTLLGIPCDEREIAQVAGTNEDGTDEEELARAATRFGCELKLIRHDHPAAAQRDLDTLLGRGTPVLLCIDQWGHWVTAAHGEDGTYVVFDSRDSSVVTVSPWDQLRPRLAYQERAPDGSNRALYDLHPVQARLATPRRARISLTRAGHLRLPENRSLALGWSRYLEDLLQIAVVPSGQCDLSVPLIHVIRERCDAISARAHEAVATVDAATRRRILDNMCFVADAYQLEIAVGMEEQVVSRVSDVLVRRARAALV